MYFLPGTEAGFRATMQWMRLHQALAGLCLALVGLTACGGDPPLDLSPAAAEGRQIANSSGCAACHGKNGQGTTAPSWQEIYLTQIPLDDGTSVLADDDYLYRSITDPQAEIVDSWTIKMPQNDLDDTEIASIITYIKELR